MVCAVGDVVVCCIVFAGFGQEFYVRLKISDELEFGRIAGI